MVEERFRQWLSSEAGRKVCANHLSVYGGCRLIAADLTELLAEAFRQGWDACNLQPYEVYELDHEEDSP